MENSSIARDNDVDAGTSLLGESNPALRRPLGRAMTATERSARFRARARDRQRSACERVIQPGQDGGLEQIQFIRDPSIEQTWPKASARFNSTFMQDEFGHACTVCDRLWFASDLKPAKPEFSVILEPDFGLSIHRLCSSCIAALNRHKLPSNSTCNGFKYPSRPDHLPDLDPISRRLISPRLPFMAIRRLTRDGQYGIIGQVINMPVDVPKMVRSLPRQLDDDYAINVAIKKNKLHKSSYLSGFVKKEVVKIWLAYLIHQPLYVHENITIDQEIINSRYSDHRGLQSGSIEDETDPDFIEATNDQQSVNEHLLLNQQTLLWDESRVLEIAPAAHSRPLNIMFDWHAEELSFPDIYFGVGRNFLGNRVTNYMIANSEIRRSDRRGVTPEHILYMAMRIMRQRVVDGITNTFRNLRFTEGITRRMIEDRTFLTESVDRDFSFLKSVPNSVEYWVRRKGDLFAMLRQLGKPTAFMTLSASEIRWPDLLKILHRLGRIAKHINVINPLLDLDRATKAKLVNEDPVVCCIYFKKLVDVIITLISSKRGYNPFGKYRVKDFFKRIEFQHRGSPHAHILLWLENDPRETVSEVMCETIQMATDLCSVSIEDLGSDLYPNQTHKHTFTCTKRGESHCRFNIPYWPMKTTRVLLPMSQDDGRRAGLRVASRQLHDILETRRFSNVDEFLRFIGLNEASYLDHIRSTISRPTMLFKRDMDQLMTNTFHPWIAKVLNSNMDLQIILEEFSCAAYIVDYVNKTNRGIGNLHRELVRLNEAHPEMAEEQIMKEIAKKVINAVEISAQEAAWYLLRMPMSQASRECIYIPTKLPEERTRSHKQKQQMDAEGVDQESTDIWTKDIIQKYEERPNSLSKICLADFAALYTQSRGAQVGIGDPEEYDEMEVQTLRRGTKERQFARVIRYRSYDASDVNNYKREMVLLFVPFRNELVDILDRNKYLQVYDENLNLISQKICEYDTGCNMEQTMKELERVRNGAEETVDVSIVRENILYPMLNEGGDNFDDIDNPAEGGSNTIVRVGRRENVMSSEEYCTMMRTTNDRQRQLILEVIHRLNSDSEPLQIFLTGPAGCGKTYTLKLLMETFNRYSQTRNNAMNSYLACASTGKAAVNLGGTTVHSAFRICVSRTDSGLPHIELHRIQNIMSNVVCIVVDEVSMIGTDILHKINSRLQEMTGNLEDFWGGRHIIFSGDFKQLPPVRSSPVYKGSRSHLEGRLLWHQLDYYPLIQVMRQSDIRFSAILTKVGSGLPLSEEEGRSIESRFVRLDWANVNLKGVIRIFWRNNDVDNFNSQELGDARVHQATDNMQGYSSNEELARARGALHKMSIMETGGMPYILKLKIGYPYMLTANIDCEDGLVNGSIGRLVYIDDLPRSVELDLPPVLYFEFHPAAVGQKARLKSRAAYLSTNIQSIWTPMKCRTISITCTQRVKCKRTQFCLVPACAITIHKSQGGTFDKVVVGYDKSQPTQLVYVALSRVTTLDGLYLTNEKNETTFHHKRGSQQPSILEVRNEYKRLEQHPLHTLANDLKDFLDAATHNSGNQEPDTIICTVNAQSLMAHEHDILSDSLLTRADIFIMTETWILQQEPSMDGFELIARYNSDLSENRTAAGGVAIYRRSDSQFNCVASSSNSTRNFRDDGAGDITLVDLLLDGDDKFVIAAIYIHPRTSETSIKMLILYALDQFRQDREISADQERNANCPLLVTGDFNTNIMRWPGGERVGVLDDCWLIQFMSEKFGLSYNSSGPTTLGNTTIDLTFSRGLEVETQAYVSYFSYHRPLFNKVSLRHDRTSAPPINLE